MKVSSRVKKSLSLFAALMLAAALALPTMLAGCTNSSSTTDTTGDTTSTTTTTPSTDTTNQAKTPPATYTFTDDLGNSVTVNNPQRVVACMGSFANIWELAGGTLVGATTDAAQDYTLASPNVQTVGDFSSPDIEQIIALNPDFVIMTGISTGQPGTASQVDLRDALVSSNIPVAYFNVTTFDDYLRMLRICCDITGRDDLYQQNGSNVEQQISTIKSEAATQTTKPTVLLMTTYSGGTVVQNSSTMTGAMLADLGAVNLADQNPSLLKDFSIESIISLNPDYILVVPMGNDDAAALKNLEDATAANPAWSTLSAVKNGHYLTLDKTLFMYKPNNLWSTSYQTLYSTLYG